MGISFFGRCMTPKPAKLIMIIILLVSKKERLFLFRIMDLLNFDSRLDHRVGMSISLPTHYLIDKTDYFPVNSSILSNLLRASFVDDDKQAKNKCISIGLFITSSIIIIIILNLYSKPNYL